MKNNRYRSAKKGAYGVVIVAAAVLLIFIGVHNISVRVAGKTATAAITRATQVIEDGESFPSRNPNRYRIHYEFSVDGKNYTGAATQIFKSPARAGQTIRVYYLPLYPDFNSANGDANLSGGMLMVGLGALLLVLEIKGELS